MKLIFQGPEAPAYGLAWTVNFVNPVQGDTLSIHYYSSISPISPPYYLNCAWDATGEE